MSELYWITVLGNLSIASLVLLIISILAWVALGICFLEAICEFGNDNDLMNVTKSIAKKIWIPTVVSLLLTIFIPTSRELLMIYGIGGVIDYVQENPDVKQLPDKYIKILNKWADDELKNDSIK